MMTELRCNQCDSLLRTQLELHVQQLAKHPISWTMGMDLRLPSVYVTQQMTR